MNAVLTMLTRLCIDNRPTDPIEPIGRNAMRPTSLDSAAVFPRHFRPPCRPVELVENADGAPACGTARRPQRSAHEPERCGSSGLRSLRADERCVMINIDPESSERDPAILRTLARERQACLGVYGSTVTPGCVAVGDPVLIEVS
ncbi:MAG: hypothetical protein DLM71_06410 [Chloroflexi bacterium]|nr:MAG: hypothetical protein DLM71_06410 [Chloroflexota bacterium]